MLHSCCALCSQPAAAAVNLGPLLGPIRDAKNPAADELYVHRLCALWSPEVFETDHGTLRNVLAAIKRGRLMKCSQCGRKGATLGCRVPACNCSYHVACAKEAGCTYYCGQFQVACPTHARQFQLEARQQLRRTPFTPFRQSAAPPGTAQRGGALDAAGSAELAPEQTPGGGLDGGADLASPVELPTFVGRKRGRRQAAMRQHMEEAHAAMKRARRELQRQRKPEVESSDDDEHFQKKEAHRLARDTAKLNPITLMGDGTAVQHIFVKSPGGAGKGLKEAKKAAGPGMLQPQGQQPPLQQQQQRQPTVETAAVGSISATDFSNVAGLDNVVRQLREMVLLPMQYPALFEGMGLCPPRGILFHGVPGTGKTLVARALAGACAKHSPLPVTFFARKGADCLGKFHGEAERTLRLLFEEASRRAPAIIFLDELDALVPARAARAGGGDQIYASVVSTLLSLMDGVTDRGSVIVIGATNRPEAIDPALRRPGRFDREVYFGLPTPAQRLAILKVHTQRWSCTPSEELLQKVAGRAEGYAGADLQSLCTAAVMAAVRRSSPMLLEQAEREAAAVTGQAAAAPGGAAAGGAAGAAAVRGSGGRQQAEQQQEQAERRRQLLDGIEVQGSDWKEAFGAAPPPCSRRHGLSALAAEAAAPLQQHALPLVVEPLQRALAALHAADLPLPPPAAAAAKAAASMYTGLAGKELGAAPGDAKEQQQQQQQEEQQQQQQVSTAVLEAVLLKHGALLPRTAASPDAASAGPVAAVACTAAAAAAAAAAAGAGAGASTKEEQMGDEDQQLQRLGRSYLPCRLLLCGEGEQGQEAAAGAVLKLLDGCPVHCLSLPSLVVEGGEDATAGCVALVNEALRRAGPHTPCVFYLPRLESWALSQTHMQSEELEQGGWFCRPASNGTHAMEEEARGEEGGSGRQPSSAQRGGMHSPSFGTRVTSPKGGSPGQHGFPAAASPFSGLLPLEERAGHTPPVSRALRSVTQQHRQHEQAHQAQQAQQGHGGEEGPTMRDLQQRASSAELGTAGTAGRPLRPPPLVAAPVLAPPTGLTPIRTSASPEQQKQQQQQQQQQQPVKTAGTASQQLNRPAAAAQPVAGVGAAEGEEVEEGEEREVEFVCLSQAWSVFESLMRQVPSNQPVIVLATCHAAPDATPANLVKFFAGPAMGASGTAGTAGRQQQLEGQLSGLQPGPTADSEEATAAAAAAADVVAPTVIRMPRPSADAWQRAAAAAAEQAAAAVATQAAVLWHRQLIDAAAGRGAGQAAVREGAAGSRQPDRDATSSAPQQQQQQQALTPNRRRRQREQQEQEEEREQQERAAAQCNTAELEQGLRLFDRLLSWQQQMGAALAKERVAALHQWVASRRPSAAGAGGRRKSGPAAAPTFAQITQRCQRAGYDTADALQADAAAAAAQVLALVGEERQRREREGRRGRQQEPASQGLWQEEVQAAVTAACSVQDKIETACFALRQELQLAEPNNARLLAAAAAHVRRLQREEEGRREEQLRGEEEDAQRRQQEEEEQGEDARRRQEEGEDVQQQQEEEEEGGQAPQQQREEEEPGPVGMEEETGDRQGRQLQSQTMQQEAEGEEAMQDCMPAAAKEDPSEATQQQHQRQQDAVAPATAEQRREQQQCISRACLLFQRQLSKLLLPAVLRRLPSAAPAEPSAWQALQEAIGQLSTTAAAACNGVVAAEVAAGDELAAGGCWEAGAEQAAFILAARCVAAVEAQGL